MRLPAEAPIGTEVSLASLQFQPWFEDGRDVRCNWTVRVELLDRKITEPAPEGLPSGLQRYVRMTVRDGAGCSIREQEAIKQEGEGMIGPLRAALTALGRDCEFADDQGCYSPSWLAGYLSGMRQP